MSKNQHGSPLTVILLSVVALGILSLLPWSELTGGRLKDFNLLGDLIPEADPTHITDEATDPALAAVEAAAAAPEQADSTAADSTAEMLPPPPLPDSFKAPRSADGSSVLIEDYSGGAALAALRSALAQTSGRVVRIGVAGDSYIEGDIFTQNVRSLLQETYGGSGVGYMSAHSNFPGFRQSVRQTDAGWTEHDMRNVGSSDPVKPLWGEYFSGNSGATVTYKGSGKPPHADSWSRSTLLVIAPSGGSLSLTTDGGEVTHTLSASPDVQAVSLGGATAKLAVTSSAPTLKVLGAWLDSDRGIALDCMSLRGNSGLTLGNLNADIARQTRQWIDYDLIVVQYGINALTANRSDYSAYTAAMVKGVEHLKSLYPNSVILVMGIGDRGEKHGATVGSMSTAPAMVRAQRDIARRTGSLFWDTREAMGGDGAAADWHSRHFINADYIHLNHKGGAELADIFVKSLLLSVNDR